MGCAPVCTSIELTNMSESYPRLLGMLEHMSHRSDSLLG